MSDPSAPMPPPSGPPVAPELFRPQIEIDGPPRQRRLTVLVRALLVIPHLFVLMFVSIAAEVVLVIGWFAALILGRLPNWIATFLTGYLAWSTRVNAYAWLMVDRYPEFSFDPRVGATRIEVQPGKLNRAAVFFRIILVFPASIVLTVFAFGWGVAAFVIWLIVLILGRMPVALFEASAAVLRLQFRTTAYMYLLTGAYPLVGAMGDGPAPSTTEQAGPKTMPMTRPLLVSGGGRGLLIVFILLGAIGYPALIGVSAATQDDMGDPAVAYNTP